MCTAIATRIKFFSSKHYPSQSNWILLKIVILVGTVRWNSWLEHPQGSYQRIEPIGI